MNIDNTSIWHFNARFIPIKHRYECLWYLDINYSESFGFIRSAIMWDRSRFGVWSPNSGSPLQSLSLCGVQIDGFYSEYVTGQVTLIIVTATSPRMTCPCPTNNTLPFRIDFDLNRHVLTLQVPALWVNRAEMRIRKSNTFSLSAVLDMKSF